VVSGGDVIQITISLRSLVFVLVLGAILFTGSDVATGAPSSADLSVTDNIVFTGPGQNGARDIRTTGNLGGIRIYANGGLANPPTTAALQFFGNGHTTFPGQAFIDSGANNNAAIIFRTAPASQGVAERMRVAANGNVGIGTATPKSTLQVVGNYIQIPAGITEPPAADCDEAAEGGRIFYQMVGTPRLWLCTVFPGFTPTLDWRVLEPFAG
jgi:hypothetical protein